MGLASMLLGEKNPFAQWVTENQNKIGAAGAGLAAGPDFGAGLSNAGQYAAQAAPLDATAALQRKAAAEQEKQQTASQQWMLKNYPQYANLPVQEGLKLAFAAEEQKQIGAVGGGPYDGTSMDAQNWNIILTGDPSSPEYGAAYSQLTAPKMTLQQTENGLVPVYQTPSMPAGVRPPSGMGGGSPAASVMPQGMPSAQPAPAPSQPFRPSMVDAPMGGMGMPPSSAPVSATPNIGLGTPIPGTKKPGTEAQVRNAAITGVLISEIPKVGQNFQALTDPKGQLLSMAGPLGNPWQSEEYQRAASALSSSISQVLYSLSGATANPGEVINQTANLTPAWGDKPGVIADKLDRFKTLVRSVAKASGDPELQAQVEAQIAALGLPPAATQGGGSTKYPGVTITPVN